MQMDGKVEDKPCASMQQSSSQFFYFLRLMQLFPDTHPATLHTVLTLCKNDFFCAVDKLLYAKRCKIMYNRRQSLYQKFCHNRSQPYSNTMTVKPSTIQSKDKNVEKPGKSNLEKTYEVAKQSVIVKTNETLADIQISDAISISVPDTLPISPNKETENHELTATIVDDLTDENITI